MWERQIIVVRVPVAQLEAVIERDSKCRATTGTSDFCR